MLLRVLYGGSVSSPAGPAIKKRSFGELSSPTTGDHCIAAVARADAERLLRPTSSNRLAMGF